jgi:hypothetical protein
MPETALKLQSLAFNFAAVTGNKIVAITDDELFDDNEI